MGRLFQRITHDVPLTRQELTAPEPESENGPAPDGATPMAQFCIVLTVYAGWSALAWLSVAAGTLFMAQRAAGIMLLGVGATNILFFFTARSNALQQPPMATIALAQCVVGIAWATLFAFMSTGAGELIIGIYASIVLFAVLRVGRNTLNQIAVFAVVSYAVVNLVQALSGEPPAVTVADLTKILVFAAIMFAISVTGGYVHRLHRRLQSEHAELQARLSRADQGNTAHSVRRRYILDILSREKGRTNRSNVPFCICLFNADIAPTPGSDDDPDRLRAAGAVEVFIRNQLRDMDSLNATGFHDCFGPYSDTEYVAILPQTGLAGAGRTAERILAACNKERDGELHGVTLYCGIAEYRRGESTADLLARADDALGRARLASTSRICSAATPAPRHAEIVRLEPRRS